MAKNKASSVLLYFIVGISAILVAAIIISLVQKGDRDTKKETFNNLAIVPNGQRKHPEGSSEAKRQLSKNTKKATQLYKQHQDPLVAEFLGLSEQTGFSTASRAAEKIFDRGNSDDISFLFSILTLARPIGFSEKEWQAMQSRSLDYLVDEWTEHDVAEGRLLSMLKDGSVSDYVKDGIIARADSLHSHSNQPEKIEALLWRASELKKTDIASTALTSLSRIRYQSNQINTSRLHDLTLKIVDSPQSSDKTLIVAMEIANRLKSPDMQKRAKKILASNNQQPQSEEIQIAAINTLIRSENNEHIPLLKEVSRREENSALKRAAAQAIMLLERNANN